MPAANVVHVPSKTDATALALQRVRPGDLVLVKGSRGTRTDIVADRIATVFV
jgi:UDP-N-acetylmuramyl pentapeptide synthase